MPDAARTRRRHPTQLDLFANAFPASLIHTRPYLGWRRCDCGLVFWVWPRGTGKLPHECSGSTGAPDLRPYRPWTCWQDIRRMTPGAPDA